MTNRTAFILDQCDVKDGDGNHCPRPTTKVASVNGKVMILCEDCFTNSSNGSYGRLTVEFIADIPTDIPTP